MPWREVSSGRFERPLDTLELMFKGIADQSQALNKEHWFVRVFASFRSSSSPDDVETALRHAWKALRYDHPQIACYAEGNNKVYETPSSTALESWLAKTFHVARSVTAESLIGRILPSPQSTIHFLPDTSEVVICASHWQIDGVGALELLNNLFSALAQPRHIEFGAEAMNLSPGLDEVAKFPNSPTREDDIAAADLLMQYFGNLPSIGLPANLTNPLPGITRRAVHELPAATSREVIEACKARKLSITTALHSALILATKLLDSRQPQPLRYTSWASFSLRPYLQDPYNIRFRNPVTAYMVGFPVTMIPSTFMEQALQLQPFYKQLSSTATRSSLPSYLKPYISQATDLFTKPPAQDGLIPTEPVLDSLGIADRYLNRFYGDTVELLDFWLASDTLTAQLTVYVWTWQGKMTFSVCYNEQFHEKQGVTAFLRTFLEILLDELGVAPQVGAL